MIAVTSAAVCRLLPEVVSQTARAPKDFKLLRTARMVGGCTMAYEEPRPVDVLDGE